MSPDLISYIWSRAGHRCEYCHLPSAGYPLPLQMDHIIARQHGGETDANNLALACVHCNRHKGPNIGGIDPATGSLTRLFHPRCLAGSFRVAWRRTAGQDAGRESHNRGARHQRSGYSSGPSPTDERACVSFGVTTIVPRGRYKANSPQRGTPRVYTTPTLRRLPTSPAGASRGRPFAVFQRMPGVKKT